MSAWPDEMPVDATLAQVADRLARLEVRQDASDRRQRAAGLHDPDCPAIGTETHERLNWQICDCWLYRDEGQ